MFKAAKDAMASKAAQVYINSAIARYGKVQDLKIDSGGKSMSVVCLLQGESEPVSVRVTNYVIHSVGEKKFVEAKSITCSRPWLQNLLQDFALGRRVEVPPWAASAL
jgi:hypothetical protein